MDWRQPHTIYKADLLSKAYMRGGLGRFHTNRDHMCGRSSAHA